MAKKCESTVDEHSKSLQFETMQRYGAVEQDWMLKSPASIFLLKKYFFFRVDKKRNVYYDHIVTRL